MSLEDKIVTLAETVGADVRDLKSDKANKTHTHTIEQVTGLQEAIITKKAALRQNIKVTVGAGGNFTTINDAVSYLSLFTPDFGVYAEIELQSGFVMQEQLFVLYLDLGWIVITGVDAETVIDEPSLTRQFATGVRPAFGVARGTLPMIGQLFVFSNRGNVADGRSGVIAYEIGRVKILSGCGVKNAGDFGIASLSGSTINAVGAIASGAGNVGIAAMHGSSISAQQADVSNAGNTGIRAVNSSTINAVLANVSNAGRVGIIATAGSTINAQQVIASGAGNIGILASGGSTINALSANVSNAVDNGITVEGGSTINAHSVTGTLSQAKNTVTANGIIFQP